MSPAMRLITSADLQDRLAARQLEHARAERRRLVRRAVIAFMAMLAGTAAFLAWVWWAGGRS